MRKGDVVTVISKHRYSLLAERAKNALEARELESDGLDTEEKLTEKLLSLHATTQMVLESSRTKSSIADAHVKEATDELNLAKLNLSMCEVRAPFSGHLAVRYKQPFEPVDRLEKIFAIVDSSKVFAVGNMPEGKLDAVKLGMKADFVRSNGQRFSGTVERIGKLIDPQSRTKRIRVLIDNPKSELEIGMLGSIQLRE